MSDNVLSLVKSTATKLLNLPKEFPCDKTSKLNIILFGGKTIGLATVSLLKRLRERRISSVDENTLRCFSETPILNTHCILSFSGLSVKYASSVIKKERFFLPNQTSKSFNFIAKNIVLICCV